MSRGAEPISQLPTPVVSSTWLLSSMTSVASTTEAYGVHSGRVKLPGMDVFKTGGSSSVSAASGQSGWGKSESSGFI